MNVVNLVLSESVQNLVNEITSKTWTAEACPNTSKAIQASLQNIQTVWADYLSGDIALDGIGTNKKPSGKAASSLRNYMTGPFAGEVTTNSPEVEKIQTGTKDVEYDMKKTHPYGRKSRVSKKGIPYLIVPFRWGTPSGKKNSLGEDSGRARFNNTIPLAFYNTVVKGMEASSRTGLTHLEQNYKGENIPRSEYTWKSRIKKSLAWSDNSVGMVRMKDVRNSTYFTFRIISAKSPPDSWIYKRKGTDGVDMLGALARTVEEDVCHTIEQGLLADL